LVPVPEFRLAFPYPDAAVIELPRWQQPDSRTRNALIRSLRGLGERGFALLTQRWTTLQNVTASPSRIGDIAKAALVLVQFEHKMIELKSLRKPQCVRTWRPPLPRPAGAGAVQEQHAGLLELDAQPSATRIRLPEGAARKVSASVRRACIPDTYAASGPNREPGRSCSPATEQPGIRRLRIGLPARQWRLRDACRMSRLNDLLALWFSGAHAVL
jgi:hypothetical protein